MVRIEVFRNDFSPFTRCVKDYVNLKYLDRCLRDGYIFLLDYFEKTASLINGAVNQITLTVDRRFGSIIKMNPETIQIKIWNKRFLSDIIWSALIPLGYPDAIADDLFTKCLEKVIAQTKEGIKKIVIELELPDSGMVEVEVPELEMDKRILARLFYAENKKMIDDRLNSGTTINLTMLEDGSFDIREDNFAGIFDADFGRPPADYIIYRSIEENESYEYELRKRTMKTVFYR